MKIIIAIDPGHTGGVAIMFNEQVEVRKMPETMADTLALLQYAQSKSNAEGQDIRCFIERVSGFAGEGQPGSAMFNFGCGYGAIQGMLLAMKIPYELVSPSTWQAGLNLGTRGLQRAAIAKGMNAEQKKAEVARVAKANYSLKKAWKNKLKSVAQQLYPYIVPTLATSDCLLILEYARRREGLGLVKKTVVLKEPVAAPSPQKELSI
jgi:hypothetical protein